MCGRYTIMQDLAGLEKLVRFMKGSVKGSGLEL